MTETAVDAAVRIARSSRSPMERAASALDPTRYRIFCAAYASMRVIDDFVDDEFLAAAASDRAARRPAAEATVEAWRADAVAALGGAGPAAGARFADTSAALAWAHGAAALDAGPWDRLAEAMRRDVAETPMREWADFLAYAEGATAAPAAVFIEILALAPGAGDRLASRLAGPAVERIRNCAILLYLVHIMRDLEADAAKGAELLTLPASMFADLGVTAEGFARRAAAAPESVAAARAEIARYAGRFLLPALAELAALDAALAPDDARILRALCEPYVARFEAFAAALD